MKGSTFKYRLSTGQLQWGFVYDTFPSGVRKQNRKRGYASEKAASNALHLAITESLTGAARPAAQQTLHELFDYWTQEYCHRKLGKKTLERYRDSATYILERIGHVPIDELDLYVFEKIFDDLGSRPGKRGRPLSPKTLKNIHSVFRGMFQRALNRYRLLKVNPLIGVDLPSDHRKPVRTLDLEDLRRFVTQSLRESTDWLRPLAALAAGSGARRGEMLAARWSDLDPKKGTVTFARSLSQTRDDGPFIKTTKTCEIRSLPLPPFVFRELETHRERQVRNRTLFGAGYRTDLDLIFAAPDGNFLRPDSVTSKVCLVMEKMGLKGSLHTLRHSSASELFDVVPLTTISKRLGHSSTRTTSEVYSHGLRRNDGEASDAMEKVFGSAFDGPVS